MLPPSIGPYRIVRQLGEGGMGVVYEAVNDAIERRVAVKVLHPEYARDREASARFFDEARAVNRIEHPSLVQVSDHGQTADGTSYLVMEFLRGESLAQRLDKIHAAGRRFDAGEVVRVAWQVADALRAAHEKNIVHRDLKPDNLMLVRDPIAPGGERVKILDFGIAKLLKNGTRRTATSAVMGTPLYMSPEQCRGAGEVDERSDVYSLGVVLYEMLGGRCPFVAEGGGELLGMHLFKEPPPLAGLAPAAPPELVALTHRLLLKDKNARPTMAEIAGELSRIGSRLPGASQIPLLPQGGDVTTLLASPPVAVSPDRASTLGRSVGERGRQGRAVRLWTGLGVGGVLGVAGALWLAGRGPVVPDGKIAPRAQVVGAPSPPVQMLAPVLPDGGVQAAGAAVRPALAAPVPAAAPSPVGAAGVKASAGKPARPQATPVVHPKAPPTKPKSAFSDVD